MLLTIVYGVLFVGEICLTALVGLELVQRLVPAVSRQRSDDVAGFIYAALGVIYAVLLALMVSPCGRNTRRPTKQSSRRPTP